MSTNRFCPFLRIDNNGEATRITPTRKELGETDLQAIKGELCALADQLPAHGTLELDLADVRYLTSTALGVFVSLNRKVKNRGGHFSLVNVTEGVYEIFELTQLHRVLRVCRSPDNAQRSSKPRPLAS